jgi:hypothetical protein
MLIQGVLPTRHEHQARFAGQLLEENSLMRHGRRSILGILRRLLSRHSPSQAQGHGPLGVAQDDKGLRVFMNGSQMAG